MRVDVDERPVLNPVILPNTAGNINTNDRIKPKVQVETKTFAFSNRYVVVYKDIMFMSLYTVMLGAPITGSTFDTARYPFEGAIEIKELGQGTYGRVIQSQLTTGHIVAIKIQDSYEEYVDGLDANTLREISCLQVLRDCQGIVQLLNIECQLNPPQCKWCSSVIPVTSKWWSRWFKFSPGSDISMTSHNNYLRVCRKCIITASCIVTLNPTTSWSTTK